jgi:hypothetical protein
MLDGAEDFAVPVVSVIFLVVISILFAVLGILLYILKGLAIYRMSQTRGIGNGWLGFIPYASEYQLGQLAGEIELGNKKIKNTGLWLLLLPMVSSAVLGIAYLIMFLPLIIKMSSLGDNPTNEEIYSVVSILVISLCVVVLVAYVVQILINLFRCLALHKIFSRYSTGQKPVFYLLLAMLVPFAEEILLFRHRKRPLLVTNTQA